jgi:hypothetical protein
MKKHISKLLQISSILLVLSLSTWLSGCEKYGPAPIPSGYSQDILNILPQATIDSLQNLGLRIHEGFDPPNMAGIYLVTPYTLTVQFSPEDPYPIGKVISDYKYRFYDLQEDSLTVKFDFKSLAGNDTGSGTGGFVSGEGNSFTIFSQVKSLSNGFNVTQVAIFTGELTPEGIKDFQYAFVLTSKDGDEANQSLIPENTGRVYIDGDSLAERVSVYRLGQYPSDTGGTLTR